MVSVQNTNFAVRSSRCRYSLDYSVLMAWIPLFWSLSTLRRNQADYGLLKSGRYVYFSGVQIKKEPFFISRNLGPLLTPKYPGHQKVLQKGIDPKNNLQGQGFTLQVLTRTSIQGTVLCGGSRPGLSRLPHDSNAVWLFFMPHNNIKARCKLTKFSPTESWIP